MTTLVSPEFDALTHWGMLGLALAMALMWLGILRKSGQSQAWVAPLTLAALFAACALGDALHLFARTDIAPPPFVLLVGFALALALGIGRAGKRSTLSGLANLGQRVIDTSSVQTLIGLQIFRLPLELLMLRAALLGIMPLEFSILGYNFDMLTGIGALALWAYAATSGSLPRMLVWTWNILGMACLAVIGALAVLTSPSVHGFGAGAAHINSWVLYFPYTLLPVLLVPFALLGHLLLTRKLLSERDPCSRLTKNYGQLFAKTPACQREMVIVCYTYFVAQRVTAFLPTAPKSLGFPGWKCLA